MELGPVSPEEVLDFCEARSLSLIALDEALRGLEALDPLQSRIVEMRFFGD